MDPIVLLCAGLFFLAVLFIRHSASVSMSAVSTSAVTTSVLQTPSGSLVTQYAGTPPGSDVPSGGPVPSLTRRSSQKQSQQPSHTPIMSCNGGNCEREIWDPVAPFRCALKVGLCPKPSFQN